MRWVEGVTASQHPSYAVWPRATRLPSLGSCFPVSESLVFLSGHRPSGCCLLGQQLLKPHSCGGG